MKRESKSIGVPPTKTTSGEVGDEEEFTSSDNSSDGVPIGNSNMLKPNLKLNVPALRIQTDEQQSLQTRSTRRLVPRMTVRTPTAGGAAPGHPVLEKFVSLIDYLQGFLHYDSPVIC